MTIKEILQRKAEIRTLLTGDEQVDLAKLEEELRGLNAQQEALETRTRLLAEAESVNAGEQETRTIETFGNESSNQQQNESEQRGKTLRENRSITVASSNLVTPKHTATNLKGTFNQVSSLIDRVTHVPLNGGESYERGFEKGHGTGGYTAEGADYSASDVVFGYASIAKSKITSYTEETEEVAKLTDADYSSVIVQGVDKSLRRKITREILVGTGGSNGLIGIFSDKATAIDVSTDMSISDITETTLDEIVFGFGGDEDVEDQAVLIINKHDLKAFVTLRTADGKKVYDVKANGNTGTIDGVPYIINSACAAITNPDTTVGAYAMAYGPLSNYELATFSPTEIKKSEDFKFKQGMICHRGSTFAGGNVVSHNGFLRIKKKA
ncbi:MAG: phage major capsid protein [Bacilli bacterium]